MIDMPNFVDIYASETSKESMAGIPGLAIPEKKTPSLKTFESMEKRRVDTSPYIRELAAQDDTFSILTQIASACMIGLWSLSARDPDASMETMMEMREWISDTRLMESLTGGAINDDGRGALYSWYTHGALALYALGGSKAGASTEKFHSLPVTGMIRMTNPKNPLEYYFYQKLKVVSDFKNPKAFDDAESIQKGANVSSTEQTIWYIPGGEGQREATGEDGEKLYPNIGTDDWVNTLESLYYMKHPSPPLNDEVISTIMSKRYILRMSPVAVQLGIAPFDKLTFGSDEFPPVPPPDENIRTTNPTLWQRQNLAHNAYKTNMQNTLDNLFSAVTQGKPFGSHPGIAHERHEPKMAVTGEFIGKMIDVYNDVIARSCGIPRSLIESLGTELATSRLTKSQIDILLASNQKMFCGLITTLLKTKYESQMLDEGIEVVLQPLDKADAKTQSEIELLVAQATETLARAGASADTLTNYVLGSEDLPIRQVEFIESTDGNPNRGNNEPPTTRII